MSACAKEHEHTDERLREKSTQVSDLSSPLRAAMPPTTGDRIRSRTPTRSSRSPMTSAADQGAQVRGVGGGKVLRESMGQGKTTVPRLAGHRDHQ